MKMCKDCARYNCPYRDNNRGCIVASLEDPEASFLPIEDFDWTFFRREAVRDILCHILPTDTKDLLSDKIRMRVTIARIYADELIKQLKEEKNDRQGENPR